MPAPVTGDQSNAAAREQARDQSRTLRRHPARSRRSNHRHRQLARGMLETDVRRVSPGALGSDRQSFPSLRPCRGLPAVCGWEASLRWCSGLSQMATRKTLQTPKPWLGLETAKMSCSTRSLKPEAYSLTKEALNL